MAKKTRVILVNEGGEVEQVTVNRSEIKKIKWRPDIEDETITITFDPNKFPFDDISWNNGKKKGSSVTGKLDPDASGPYDYDAKGWGKQKRRDRNPKLIVEGGRPKAKKKKR